MRLAALIAVPLLIGAAEAEAQVFLFDALREHTYRAAWDRLMKDVQPTPDWLMQFNRNFDGLASQLVPITIDGKAYEIAYVCKPTDCANRKFEMLFEAGGAHAWGALGGRDDPPAFFGDPAPSLQSALAKGLKG
jgi:hypothetical protein